MRSPLCIKTGSFPVAIAFFFRYARLLYLHSSWFPAPADIERRLFRQKSNSCKVPNGSLIIMFNSSHTTSVYAPVLINVYNICNNAFMRSRPHAKLVAVSPKIIFLKYAFKDSLPQYLFSRLPVQRHCVTPVFFSCTAAAGQNPRLEPLEAASTPFRQIRDTARRPQSITWCRLLSWSGVDCIGIVFYNYSPAVTTPFFADCLIYASRVTFINFRLRPAKKNFFYIPMADFIQIVKNKFFIPQY